MIKQVSWQLNTYQPVHIVIGGPRMSYDLKIVCIVALIGIGTEGKSEKQKTKNKM